MNVNEQWDLTGAPVTSILRDSYTYVRLSKVDSQPIHICQNLPRPSVKQQSCHFTQFQSSFRFALPRFVTAALAVLLFTTLGEIRENVDPQNAWHRWELWTLNMSLGSTQNLIFHLRFAWISFQHIWTYSFPCQVDMSEYLLSFSSVKQPTPQAPCTWTCRMVARNSSIWELSLDPMIPTNAMTVQETMVCCWSKPQTGYPNIISHVTYIYIYIIFIYTHYWCISIVYIHIWYTGMYFIGNTIFDRDPRGVNGVKKEMVTIFSCLVAIICLCLPIHSMEQPCFSVPYLGLT